MRIPQYPTPPNEWLHDGAPDWHRIFTDYILIDDSLPAWQECTTEEMLKWKEEHPEPVEPTEEEQV